MNRLLLFFFLLVNCASAQNLVNPFRTTPSDTVSYVQYVDDLRVNYNTSWATAETSLPDNVDVIISNGSTISVPVTWAQGSYSATTAQSYQVEGTLSTGWPNPGNVTAKAIVEVYYQGHSDLIAADGVYYDFHGLHTTETGNLTLGEPGLEDLGPNNFDAEPINTPIRGRYQRNAPYLYSLYAQTNKCISTGDPLAGIVNSTRWDFFLEFLTLDGLPGASTSLMGFNDTSDGVINFFFNSGRLNVTVNDGTNSVSLQSAVILVDNQNPDKVLHVTFDWTANTSAMSIEGSSVTWTVTGGTLASIDQTSFTHTTDFYVGSVNTNGTAGSHTELLAIGRFAFVSDFSDAAATRVIDFFMNNTYPFSSINLIFQYGDSQSEGAEIMNRPINAGAAAFTPSGLVYVQAPILTNIYYKTARTSTDNGSWVAANFGVNTEFVSGANPAISNDMSLTQQLKTRLGTGHNILIMKCNEGGQRLSNTLLPPAGTNYVLATQYYWDVGYTKLITGNPGLFVKVILDFDLGTNDASDAPSVTNFSTNLNTLITSWRAYDPLFANCPIFLTENNTTLNATQLGMNVTLKSKATTHANVFYLSGDVADVLGDVLLRKRQQDLTTPEKLSITNTITGDDAHRSYIGYDAKSMTQMDFLTHIGYIPGP
jgi:hypothetical protein